MSEELEGYKLRQSSGPTSRTKTTLRPPPSSSH
uniref:Uncharacterized protein n=1 Tax=Arundo donax TaxID=35708 RepID=A0A0A9HUZ4_ARUDO